MFIVNNKLEISTECLVYPARLAAAATLLRAWTDVHESVLALLPRDAEDSRRAGDPQRLRTKAG